MFNIQNQNKGSQLHEFLRSLPTLIFAIEKTSWKIWTYTQFFENLKKERLSFGDWHIGQLIEETNTLNFLKLVNAHGFDIQNSLFTRVTPLSETCVDHLFASRHFETQTLGTTFTDHFTIIVST